MSIHTVFSLVELTLVIWLGCAIAPNMLVAIRSGRPYTAGYVEAAWAFALAAFYLRLP